MSVFVNQSMYYYFITVLRYVNIQSNNVKILEFYLLVLSKILSL